MNDLILFLCHPAARIFFIYNAKSGIIDETVWWNSITAGASDNDGDIDYITCNLGKNSFYRASHEFPVIIYARDFDKKVV